MAISVIVNGKSIRTAICWEDKELTLDMYQQFIAMDYKSDIEDFDKIKALSILTGTTFQAIEESNYEDLDAALYQHTSFIINSLPSFKAAPVPKYFKISGKSIKVNPDTGKMTVGQVLQIRKRLKERKFVEECIAYTLAVYLQPKLDEANLDVKRVDELEQEIKRMPLMDTYPLGFFLLIQLTKYGKVGLYYVILCQKINRLKQRILQGLRSRQVVWN